MRLPRVRFTVRRMMGGIAALGILLGGGLPGWRWDRLSREYAETAADFAELEAGERAAGAVYEANVGEMRTELEGLDPASERALTLKRRLAEELRDLAFNRANTHHSGAVREIYEWGASRPW